MKRVQFKDFEVVFDNGTAKVSATIEGATFSQDELKKIVGSILQGLTDTGDMYGDPITSNVTINGAEITGQQKS